MADIKKGRCPKCRKHNIYHRLSDNETAYNSPVSHYLCADCGYTEQYVHNTRIINDPAWKAIAPPVKPEQQERQSRMLYRLAARQSEMYREERHPAFLEDSPGFIPRPISSKSS